MTDVQIPDESHIARHCKGRSVDGDDVDGEAFRLRLDREEPEEYLSVNCFEMTGKDTLDEQLVDIRRDIPLTLKPKDRIARLNVGDARQRVFQNVNRLEIRVSEIDGGPASYCGVFDIPLVDRINKAVGEQLAFAASGNLHAAVV